MAYRPYIQSAPIPTFDESKHTEHFHTILGPPVYPFRRYNVFELLNLLRQWVNGVLLDSCPIRIASVLYYEPYRLWEYYENEKRPLYFFSHSMKKEPFNLVEDRVVPNSTYTLHWVPERRKEIRQGDDLRGYSRKYHLHSDSENGKCYKTRYKMEVFSLHDSEYNDPPAPVLSPKLGNWVIMKLSKTSMSATRNSCQLFAGCMNF